MEQWRHSVSIFSRIFFTSANRSIQSWFTFAAFFVKCFAYPVFTIIYPEYVTPITPATGTTIYMNNAAYPVIPNFSVNTIANVSKVTMVNACPNIPHAIWNSYCRNESQWNRCCIGIILQRPPIDIEWYCFV